MFPFACSAACAGLGSCRAGAPAGQELCPAVPGAGCPDPEALPSGCNVCLQAPPAAQKRPSCPRPSV